MKRRASIAGADMLAPLAAAEPAVPALPAVEPGATSTRPDASADPLAVREVSGLSLRLLPLLPLPSTVLCARVDSSGLVVLTTSKAAYTAALERRLPVFVGGELEALAAGVEHDRVHPAQLERWCARKLEDANWRLTRAVSLGAHGLAGATLSRWTLEQVAARVGLRVLWAGCGDELPAELGGAGEARAA